MPGIERPRARRRRRATSRELLELQPQPGERACAADGMRRRRTRCWLSSIRPTRSVISLKLRASERCSALPSTGARASRSPAATSSRGVGEPADRPRDPPRDQGPGDHPEGEDDEREQHDARPPSGGRRSLTASTLCVTRTAPTVRRRGGSARRWRGCRSEACRCGASPGSCCRRAPPRSRAGRRSSAPSSAAAGAVGDHSARAGRRRSPGRGPTRPTWRRAGRASVRSAAPSSSGALAATTSAWLRACPRTSASTRSRRLIASGTPKATTASKQHVGDREQKGAAQAYRLPSLRRGESEPDAANRLDVARARPDRRRACARRAPMWTSSVFVDPNQLTSQTRDIRSSRVTTRPALRASSASRSNSLRVSSSSLAGEVARPRGDVELELADRERRLEAGRPSAPRCGAAPPGSARSPRRR